FSHSLCTRPFSPSFPTRRSSDLLISNAWFAGFVEGDGHFGLSVPSASLEKPRGNVSPRFSIDQKEKRGEVSNGGGHTYGTPAAAAIPMVRRGGGRQRALRASCARRRPGPLWKNLRRLLEEL